MKYSLVVIVSAVAAALAAPAAVAQTASSNDPARAQERSPTDGRAGGTGMPSSTSGAVPSTEPRPGQAATAPGTTSPRAGTDRSGARLGGPTGPTGARPSEQNPTDGRLGGTGPASPTSGAVPSSETGAGTAAGDRRMSGRDTSLQGGANVRAAQQALQDKGYDVGPIDGIMGPKTQAAIRGFQQKEGIQASGQLDARTRSALNVGPTGAASTDSARRGG